MTFAHIDEKLVALSGKREEWARMDLPGKIAIIKAVIKNFKDYGVKKHLDWGRDASLAMKLDPDNVNNEFMQSINCLLNLTPLNWLTRLQASMESVVKSGAPPRVPIRTNSTGQTVADVFPQRGADTQATMKHFKAELWLNSTKQGGCLPYKTITKKGKAREQAELKVAEGVAVVLGAGNQGFLTTMDILQVLFIDNEVVLAKHHPLRGYQDGPLRAVLAPLVEGGYLDFVLDEGIPAASHLVGQALVSHVHMTGGAPTHDAIVWGVGDAQLANKAANTPVFKGRMTSELGCVTPYVIAPAIWTEAELQHHALQLAVAFVQNVSCNCNAPKVLVLSEGWAQREEFLAVLKENIKAMPLGVPYYPGTERRYRGFVEAYKGQLEEISGPPGAGTPGAPEGLPWVLVQTTHDPAAPNPDEYAFRNEAFGPVLAVCTVKASTTEAFLAAAAPLCNDLLYGRLSATLVLHPSVEQQYPKESAQLISDLHYGTIAINVWTGSTYAVDTAVWGAYPGEDLGAVQSGIGFVNNTLLFDDVEKCVVRTPFIDTVGHIGTSAPTSENIFNVVHFLVDPGVWTFAKMLAPGLGRFFGNKGLPTRKPAAATPMTKAEPAALSHVDVFVVGAGYSGVYMTKLVKDLGMSVACVDKADEVGGTWTWNQYPGSKCDVESNMYSYSWCDEVNKEWKWSNRYGRAPEIQAYISKVADHYDVKQHIQFRTTVEEAKFDEKTEVWHVRTNTNGTTKTTTTKFLIMGTGCLSHPKAPGIPGAQDFGGRSITSHNYPKKGYDFAGKRVALIGTGSTAAQLLPEVAKHAAHVTVFMRTPNWTVPAGDRVLDPSEEQFTADTKADKIKFHTTTAFGCDLNYDTVPFADKDPAEFTKDLEARWVHGGPHMFAAAPDLLVSEDCNKYIQEFLRGKIKSIVKNPETAAALTPDFMLGCKRIVVGDNFYESFNEDNVSLVNLKGKGIESISKDSLVHCGGQETQVDDIIFATGFDALTGALNAIHIVGRSGEELKTTWSQGVHTFMGLAQPNFPNLFTMTGPQSPSAISNVVASIEQHATWLAGMLQYTKDKGIKTIEATPEAAKEWSALTDGIADSTVWRASTCGGKGSWFRGENVKGKSDQFYIFVGGLPFYQTHLDACSTADYKGFVLNK